MVISKAFALAGAHVSFASGGKHLETLDQAPIMFCRKTKHQQFLKMWMMYS